MRPNWAEISLCALRRNFRKIRQHVSPAATVCAVVKAYAYGHGLIECAHALQEENASWFGVTSTDEGVALRHSGIDARILLMTGFWRGDEEDIVVHNLTPAVWESWHIEALEAAAERLRHLHTAPLPVHLKVDTGMARLGVPQEALDSFLARLKAGRHLTLEGVGTHLASSEIVDAPEVQLQLGRFERIACAVQRAGFTPTYHHVANTAAVAVHPNTWRNMVRPGLALYGYFLPFASSNGGPHVQEPFSVEPVLSWKTRVISLRSVPPGQAIGYGGAYVTQRPTRVAVLPAGYADGLRRDLSLRGRIIVRDSYAPILGKISMDLTLVDVTDIPDATIGDEVLLIGSSEHCRVDAWEHARLANTIPYEILCDIGRRVARQYV